MTLTSMGVRDGRGLWGATAPTHFAFGQNLFQTWKKNSWAFVALTSENSVCYIWNNANDFEDQALVYTVHACRPVHIITLVHRWQSLIQLEVYYSPKVDGAVFCGFTFVRLQKMFSPHSLSLGKILTLMSKGQSTLRSCQE